MQAGRPSRTALGAAAHRAAHQALESGFIFHDPLAVRILGDEGNALIERARSDAGSRRLRLFIAARSRYAEDTLRSAIAGGVPQVVVLGAGLDTFAYRSELPLNLRVYEVDHPSTQQWKRALLFAAGIAVPASVVFTPLDFEYQNLAEGLAASGFDPARRTFFTWLGVVPYLTEQTALATLVFIASLSGGAHVVFDYANPPQAMSDAARAVHDELAARVSSVGEMFRTYWETEALHARLRGLGYRQIEDLGPVEIVARFLPGRRAGAVSDRGGHILHAVNLHRSS
jgi:methyltransferase (TIGR00027 family)